MTTDPALHTNQFGQRIWTWYDDAGNQISIEAENHGEAPASIHGWTSASGMAATAAQCREIAAALTLLADEKEATP